MTELKFFLIFFIVVLLDGLVLPAFFGLRESFLSLLILIVPGLYMGSTSQFIAYGLAFALISESLRGLGLGSLATPFLFIVILIYLIQRFLDIKHTYDTRFGLGKSALVALTSTVFVYTFLFFYEHGSVDVSYFNPIIGLITLLEALILVFAFNIVFNKKSDYV